MVIANVLCERTFSTLFIPFSKSSPAWIISEPSRIGSLWMEIGLPGRPGGDQGGRPGGDHQQHPRHAHHRHHHHCISYQVVKQVPQQPMFNAYKYQFANWQIIYKGGHQTPCRLYWTLPPLQCEGEHQFSVWRNPKLERNRSRNFFPIKIFFDTEHWIRYFFRYQMFSKPIPIIFLIPIFLMVLVSVSKNFGIEKSIGIGIGKSIGFSFEKFMYRYQFRKLARACSQCSQLFASLHYEY